MTVAELIEKLSEFDGDSVVYTIGDYEDYEVAETVSKFITHMYTEGRPVLAVYVGPN